MNRDDIILKIKQLEQEKLTLESSINNQNDEILEYAKNHNLSVAGNGSMFTKDFRGFLPQLMSELFRLRSGYKKQMLEVDREIEAIKNELETRRKI